MFGIIDDESFETQLSELDGKKSEKKTAKVVDIERGRGSSKEVPIEIKRIIAEESINGTPARDLAELFGVSESSISAYKHDATSTSTYHNPNPELKQSNDAVKDEISLAARSRLKKAIESITDEKLDGARARDAAGIAKDMSAVIKNMEPDGPGRGNGINQQFIFYAPKTKKESDFEVIDARE